MVHRTLCAALLVAATPMLANAKTLESKTSNARKLAFTQFLHP